ncbi:hypothetical protein AGOR_G00043850 [Albula goreensis]|uniref:Ig-like domain-containing protein n=1 Tax=Albula goreensis TaxID=1534307 RepID=A0A8T3DYG3_9TELE|nr:hypothetical protein AGOR_G00043850 [Albula goreensis]
MCCPVSVLRYFLPAICPRVRGSKRNRLLCMRTHIFHETEARKRSERCAAADMLGLVGLCLLLSETVRTDHTVPVIEVKENGTASLPCGTSTPTRPVTWSRDTEGKQKILSLLDGRDHEIKYITDTGRRYGTAADFSLMITGVSRSDSGIYYCNGIPVQLQVITETAKDGDQEESEDDYEQEGSSSGEQDIAMDYGESPMKNQKDDNDGGSSSVQTGWKVLGMFLATLPFITATAAAVWAHSGGGAVGISQ